MNTKDIPKGWWLNVTVMALFQTEFIVGVLRRGKASWITEDIKGHFDNPNDAYKWGLDFIEKYKQAKTGCKCKVPNPVMKNSENGIHFYCSKCASSL